MWEGLDRVHSSMTAALEHDMVPEAGMPLAWYEVLLNLTRSPGGMMRYQDLARVAGITNSGASRRLEQITKAGLIERRSCPTDRRGVFAHITAKGEAAYKTAHKVFLSSLERNFGTALKKGDAELISAALSRLA
jgi:DNA-binding MarR family transcriptional regulator